MKLKKPNSINIKVKADNADGFSWITIKKGEEVPGHLVDRVKASGGKVEGGKPVKKKEKKEVKKEEPEKVEGDLDGDGDFDKDDLSIAAKTLRKGKKAKKE